MKYYKQAWAKNGVWLFVIFYGFTMAKPVGMDSSTYVFKLQQLYNAPLSWENFVLNFYSEEGKMVDIYQPLVTYVLSLFTQNGNVLFAIYGFVLGYFYSRNIWFLIERMKGLRMNGYLILFLVAFASIIGFWELNGVRMWTAAHIFFYGAFLYLVKGNKKGVIIAITSVLVHFSFILPIGVLILFRFVRLPIRFLYFFYIFSFFIAELQLGAVQNLLLSYAPEFLVPRVNSYLGESYVEKYIVYYRKSMSWFIVIVISAIYFTHSTIMNKNVKRLFGFSLLFLAVGNVVLQIPSGGRFLLVAELFGMAFLFLYMLENKNIKIKYLVKMLSPLLVFYIIVSIRVSFQTITFGTILTNPIIAVFAELRIPLLK